MSSKRLEQALKHVNISEDAIALLQHPKISLSVFMFYIYLITLKVRSIWVVSCLARTHFPLQDHNSSQIPLKYLEDYEAFHPM
jgi:hypothetical protein